MARGPRGDVGLRFRDETNIYVCAGCVSDAVRWFVPLRAGDLAPAGEPVSFASTAGGGVGRLSAVRIGDEFLAYAPIELHAWSAPALIAWRCE
ncbi:MAG: hypothetical protein FJ087_09305 [Deltaproteobacteria bacterium]|nr:hypothetical protein [Deltaproteobacteria bacterium]